jgi:hypothetical protein
MTKIAQPYTCSHCGKDRRSDANHWWLLSSDKRGVTVRPWAYKLAGRRGWLHLCGMNCLHTVFGQWTLERVRAAMPNPAPAVAVKMRVTAPPSDFGELELSPVQEELRKGRINA